MGSPAGSATLLLVQASYATSAAVPEKGHLPTAPPAAAPLSRVGAPQPRTVPSPAQNLPTWHRCTGTGPQSLQAMLLAQAPFRSSVSHPALASTLGARPQGNENT